LSLYTFNIHILSTGRSAFYTYPETVAKKGSNDVVSFYITSFTIQSDQQESKSEQALQIIGHVVAESYANKRSKHGRRQFVVSNASL
jgi:uncharacterized protein (DUF2225 family)